MSSNAVTACRHQMAVMSREQQKRVAFRLEGEPVIQISSSFNMTNLLTLIYTLVRQGGNSLP